MSDIWASLIADNFLPSQFYFYFSMINFLNISRLNVIINLFFYYFLYVLNNFENSPTNRDDLSSLIVRFFKVIICNFSRY